MRALLHASTATLLALRLPCVPRTSVRLCSSRRDDLQHLNVPELKEQLRSAGLPVSGRKAELVSRLLDGSASAPVEPVAAPAPPVAQQIVQPEPSLFEQPSSLATLTVEALKGMLREQGLPVSGKKAELLSRLAGTSTAAAAAASAAAAPATAAAAPAESSHPLDAVSDDLRGKLAILRKLHRGSGVQTGIFTDGGSVPNPGPGGWGAVAVRDGEIVWLDFASSRGETTNNAMEMTAILRTLQRLRGDERQWRIFSDSMLCVRTLNEWAAGWKARGWKKGDGKTPLNCELVKEAFELISEMKNVTIEWVPAHSGFLWNEVADCLATTGREGGGWKDAARGDEQG